MRKTLTILLALSMTLLLLLSGCGQAPAGGGSQSAGGQQNAASAGAYPEKNIEIIIPQGVGTASDLIARVLAANVEKDLGVSVICTNVEGGSTSIGLQQMVDSAPDGYTIAMSMTNLSTLQALGYSELSRADVKGICSVNFDGASLFIKTGDPRFSTLEELVAYAKDHPGELNCGTGQAGGMWHMGVCKFLSEVGIDMNIVPNAGGGVGLGLTLANGDVDCIVSCPPDVIAQLDGDAISFLCSFTSERQESFPDVPTALESGYDIQVYSTRGFVAPKDTPDEVISVLEAAFQKAYDSPEYLEYITSQSTNMLWRGAAEYDGWMETEVSTYVPILESAGLAKG